MEHTDVETSILLTFSSYFATPYCWEHFFFSSEPNSNIGSNLDKKKNAWSMVDHSKIRWWRWKKPGICVLHFLKWVLQGSILNLGWIHTKSAVSNDSSITLQIPSHVISEGLAHFLPTFSLHFSLPFWLNSPTYKFSYFLKNCGCPTLSVCCFAADSALEPDGKDEFTPLT